MYMSEQVAVGVEVVGQHDSPYMQLSGADKQETKFDHEDSSAQDDKSPKYKSKCFSTWFYFQMVDWSKFIWKALFHRKFLACFLLILTQI